MAGSAAAQEITYKFTSPTFGGNPFNADHLMSIAAAQRPEKKEDASSEAAMSEGEQFAEQIKSRLLASLSSSLVEAITGSNPGTTGEFALGDQTISFERSLTQVTVKITDTVTGEVTTIVVPVLNFNNSGSSSQTASSASSLTSSSLTSSALTTGSVLETGPLTSPLLAQ